MPPKVTVTRAHILDAAFELVRREGVEALSARAVATALGCSTQPIYRTFGSMNELHSAVYERAAATAIGFLMGEQLEPGEPAFLGMGYGNLRFAQQEPQLFRLVTQSDRVVRDLVMGAAPPELVLTQMRQVPALAAMDDEQLRRIHTLLWFFSQGLATVFEASTDHDPMPMAKEYLGIAGQAVIAWEQGRARP
jgi:AcrR family transcriptional regulator